MEYGDACACAVVESCVRAEASEESARGLGGECDFWYEYERGISGVEDVFEDSEVDLGFSGSCDAADEVDIEGVEAQMLDAGDDVVLFFCELWRNVGRFCRG